MKQRKVIAILAMILVLVLCVGVFAACNKDDDKYNATTHTYYAAMAQSPSTWNPHTQKTTYDAMPLDYTTNNLYEFEYNDTMDGYVINPVMAAADPVDVTAQYVGDLWKIEEGETGKAFRIALNKDAKWENGKAITADDYIYSMQALLDQDLVNYRAANYYSGSLAIHNAKNYVYSGQQIMVSDETLEDSDFMSGKDLYLNGTMSSYLLGEVSESIGGNTSINALYENYFASVYTEQAQTAWAANEDLADGAVKKSDYATVEDFTAAYIEYKMAGAGTNALRKAINDLYKYFKATDTPYIKDDGITKGYVKVTGNEKLIAMLKAFTTALFGQESYYIYVPAYVGSYPETTFDQVGIKKIDDYTIDLILDNELVGFYIKYNLSTNWLVYKDIYDNCKKQNSTTGAYYSNYGTSTDTYMSYGPYKITSFIDGQQMVFEKNETWFGFTDKYADRYGTFTRGIDGSTCKQYETDKIVITQAKDISTRESMFLRGQLDQLGLNAEMLSTYRSSDAIYFTEGESTFYGIICSDKEQLEARQNTASEKAGKEINKTILTIKEFRQALCYAINRTELCAALYPAGSAAYGLFSNAVMADPANSISYRSLDVAKEAMVHFWGVEYGPDKEFKTLDAAYDAITGYDIDQARKLIDKAYDIAIDSKLMSENAIVSIEFCSSEESDTETKWYNTFKSNFEKLMVGTKLEGKFEYTSNFTLGNQFGDKIRAGECDTAWGFGWSGGTLDPYGLFEVYIDSAYNADGYQYDAWKNWGDVSLTLTLDYNYDTKEATSTSYTHSVAEWAGLLFGQSDIIETLGQKWTYGAVPDSIRAQILGKLEETVLCEYNTIPMMNEGSVQLKSYKINYGQEKYIYGVGRGGIRYMTYNYTDGEWLRFCDENGGILTY